MRRKFYIRTQKAVKDINHGCTWLLTMDGLKKYTLIVYVVYMYMHVK